MNTSKFYIANKRVGSNVKKKTYKEMRKEDEKNDIDISFYHNYGKFVSEFEHLTISVKMCVFSIFNLKGLSDPEYLRAILSEQTAYPLLAKLKH